MFCTRASSKNFDKVIKSSNRPLDRDQHSIHYIPRRYVANGEDVTVILMARDKFIFLLQHFGFVINLKKSVLHPVKKNCVSGLNNRYRKNEFGSFREKKCVVTLSGDFHTAKNFSLKSDEDNWPVVVNCPDHFTSTIPVSISSTGANIRSCDTGTFSHGGTSLVDEDLETLQWEENSATRTPYNHSERCLTKAWVTYCKGVLKGEEMVKGGETFSYKRSRIIGIEICNPNFHKEFVPLDDSYPSGQQSCSGISLEDGGTRNPQLLKISQTI